jgi:hypothetical protein
MATAGPVDCVVQMEVVHVHGQRENLDASVHWMHLFSSNMRENMPLDNFGERDFPYLRVLRPFGQCFFADYAHEAPAPWSS